MRKLKSPFKKIARRSYEKSFVYMYLELSYLVILYNDIAEFFDLPCHPGETYAFGQPASKLRKMENVQNRTFIILFLITLQKNILSCTSHCVSFYFI